MPVHFRSGRGHGGAFSDKALECLAQAQHAGAKLTGDWHNSSAGPNYVGNGYRHDGNAKDGKASARFEAKIPKSGHYDVRIAYPPNTNRSSKVVVEIIHPGGKETVFVDQRKIPAIDERFHLLGHFDFTEGQPAVVIVSNAGADGFVVIDAVQWITK